MKSLDSLLTFGTNNAFWYNSYFPEEEAYICLAGLVGSKEKVFINQTKLQHEVTWKTVMQIAKKHTVSSRLPVQQYSSTHRSNANQKCIV